MIDEGDGAGLARAREAIGRENLRGDRVHISRLLGCEEAPRGCGGAATGACGVGERRPELIPVSGEPGGCERAARCAQEGATGDSVVEHVMASMRPVLAPRESPGRL